MSALVNRKVRAVSSGLGRTAARRKSVEDVPNEDQDGNEKRARKTGRGDTELPPNENLRKDAGEADGDAEIPGRKRKNDTQALRMGFNFSSSNSRSVDSWEAVTGRGRFSTVFAG